MVHSWQGPLWHSDDRWHTNCGTVLTGDPDLTNQPVRKLTSFKKFSKLKYPDCTLLQSDGINQTWLNFQKSSLHTEPNNGSNSLINVTLVYTMCCKKNETRLRARLMHIKRGTVCARSKESTAFCDQQNRSIPRTTAARDCTLPVIVLVTITLHLCQMIPGIMQSNMHVYTVAAVSPTLQLNIAQRRY